jgi:hypothetical protein
MLYGAALLGVNFPNSCRRPRARIIPHIDTTL